MGTIVRAQPKQQYFDASGNPASGYKVYTYEPGTSTLKTTYTDSSQSSANTNPVILDSRGEADIWWNGIYKVKFTDASDVEVWTVDNYGAGESASLAAASNLIANSSFEADAEGDGLPDSWDLVSYSGSTNAIDSTDQDHGINSMEFISTGSGGGYITTESFIECSPNGPLQLAFSIKSSVADVRNVVDILWYTELKVAAATATTNVYDDSTTNPTTWTSKLYTATPPSDAYYCKIRLYGCHSSDATAGATHYDNVALKPLLSENIKGADIASATALVLGGDGNYFDVTGGTSITSITTKRIGFVVRLHFDGILTLTHNATDLILPGAADITTAAGDEAEFVEYTAGGWRCTNYTRASGKGVVETALTTRGDILTRDASADIRLAVGTASQVLITDGTDVSWGAVDQTGLGAAAVGQAELKTTIGAVSLAGPGSGNGTTTSRLTLPGGEYGFYPQTRSDSANLGTQAIIYDVPANTGYATYIALSADEGATMYAQQRYIQASPPYDLGNGAIPIFVFALIDNTTGDVISTYVSEDPPWANNGPTNIRPEFIDDETGKKYQRVKKFIAEYGNYQNAKAEYYGVGKIKALYDRMVNDEYVDREVTQAIKQADMPLLPHPFNDPDMTDKTVVLLDPLGKITSALQPIIHQGGASEICEVLHGGYINIGNTDNGAEAPPGVMPVDCSFK